MHRIKRKILANIITQMVRHSNYTRGLKKKEEAKDNKNTGFLRNRYTNQQYEK